MSKLSLPPSWDVPSIIKSSPLKTVEAWYQHLLAGAQAVRVAPGIDFAQKVYGQGIHREAATAGKFSKWEKLDQVTKDIVGTLCDATKGRLIQLGQAPPVILPFRRDGLKLTFPVPALIIADNQPTFLCIQARKKPPFPFRDYAFFGAMLSMGIDRGPFPGADCEVCDISAPDGLKRKPSIFRLSTIRLLTEDAVNDRLDILAEAYDTLKTMKLPEPKKRPRRKPPGQGEWDF